MINHFDFIIVGSTPLSAVLAGVLSKMHGASVCWAGQFRHPLRPQNGFDISVGPSTRPETWQLLRTTVPQTTKILRQIGDGKLLERVDTLLVSQAGAGAEALAHIRNIAPAYRVQAERVAISENFGDGYRFRDVTRVFRRPLLAALPGWLEANDVTIIADQSMKFIAQRDGLTRIEVGEQKITAKSAWLCGGEALMRHGREEDINALFAAVPKTSLLMEPTRAMPSAVMQAIDTGLTVYQRDSGALDCIGCGDINTVGTATAALIAQDAPLRLAGQSQFISLESRDGGPIVGSARAGGISYLGGLGSTGMFQIPAIARVLTQTASPFEVDYFAKRSPSSALPRPNVAEFLPPHPVGVHAI